MFQILLVEDDADARKQMEAILTQHGYQPLAAVDGAEALQLLESRHVDLIVLSVPPPNTDGYSFVRSLRDKKVELPIMMVSARDSIQDKRQGFLAGTDDYLVKPFEFVELLARLRALGRRSSQKIQQDIMELGGFTLDRTSKLLLKGKQEIQLSPREFQIFDLLVQNMGIVVPREIILDRIWGIESDVSSNNIDSYVKLIRKKLDLADGGIVISTIRGVGYKLEIK